MCVFITYEVMNFIDYAYAQDTVQRRSGLPFNDRNIQNVVIVTVLQSFAARLFMFRLFRTLRLFRLCVILTPAIKEKRIFMVSLD